MTKQEKISNLIERYLSNELKEAEREALLVLINENQAIKDEFILRDKINKAVQKKDIIDLRHKLKDLSKKYRSNHSIEEPKGHYKVNWYRTAAIIILLIGAGVVLNYKLDKRELAVTLNDSIEPHEKVENIKNIPDTSNGRIGNSETETSITNNINIEQSKDVSNPNQSSEKEILLALNEDKSEYFESFIVNYRADGIVTMLPKPSAVFITGKEILFKWNIKQYDSILLSIFNNKEELVHSFSAQNQFIFAQKLSPGLYYWKLESEDDLLYLNKFLIHQSK